MSKGNKSHLTGSSSRHFICECGYAALSKTGIRLHRRITHGINTEKDLSGRADNFRCTLCRKVFDNSFQLLTHARLTGHTK